MKIVITASGISPLDSIDPRFGRAVAFLLYDTETETYVAHDNQQSLNAPQGAGIQAAQTVERLGAEVVITGHCGPKAFRVLQAAGIRVVLGAQGSVEETVACFRNGGFTFNDSADVEGHWV